MDENSIVKPVIAHLGQEQREELEQDIEALYERLVQEGSDGWKEINAALIQLRKAHEVVLENKGSYDEALHLIAGVKEALDRKHTLRRWSQTWGLFTFFYALIWLALLTAAFFLGIEGLSGSFLGRYEIFTTTWYAALAGGIGGTVAILYSFSQVVVRNEFDHQDLRRYLVQPVGGFIAGAVMTFLIGSGLLVVTNPFDSSNEPLSLSQFVLIFLGGLAGFGQEFVYKGAKAVIIRFSRHKSKAV